jgi:hypothetical protein
MATEALTGAPSYHIDVPFSPDAVLALAPDAAWVSAASAIAAPARWRGLAAGAGFVWGQVQGSALYRVGVALEAPAFTCSCPSPKVPCKHGLALLLVFARAPEAFAAATAAPDWLTDWDERRRSREARRARGEIADPDAQARRLAERERRILAGLDDLERWLDDLVRQGLAAAAGRGYGFWDAPAARLVDAQAPGLARRVRALASVAVSGPGWPERLLERIGLIYILARAYRREAALPPELRAEVRQLVGWNVSQDELIATATPVGDRWRVLGQRIDEDERFRTQRIWLRGADRFALVLSFAAAGAPLDRSLRPGTTVDADLVFFPGVAPVRALVKARRGTEDGVGPWRGVSLAEARAAHAEALAGNPWLDEAPVALADVVPTADGVHDAHVARYGKRFLRAAPLLAVSGGRPVGLFAEWNGATLLPLGVDTGERYVPLDA